MENNHLRNRDVIGKDIWNRMAANHNGHYLTTVRSELRKCSYVSSTYMDDSARGKIITLVSKLNLIECYGLYRYITYLMEKMALLVFYGEGSPAEVSTIVRQLYICFPQMEGIIHSVDFIAEIFEENDSFRFTTPNDYTATSGMRAIAVIKLLVEVYLMERKEEDWLGSAQSFLGSYNKYGCLQWGDEEAIIYLLSRNKDCTDAVEQIKERWRKDFTDYGEIPNEDWAYLQMPAITPTLLRIAEHAGIDLPSNILQYIEVSVGAVSFAEGYGVCFGTPFDYFRSANALGIKRSHLENALIRTQEFLEKAILSKNYADIDEEGLHIQQTICNHAVSFIFGFYQLHSSRLDSKVVQHSVNYLLQHQKQSGCWWNNETSPHSFNIEFTAMAVHALHMARTWTLADLSSPILSAKNWLLSNISPHGYWQEDDPDSRCPAYTTVLVLDAINLANGKNGVTFMFNLPSVDVLKTQLGEYAAVAELAEAFGLELKGIKPAFTRARYDILHQAVPNPAVRHPHYKFAVEEAYPILEKAKKKEFFPRCFLK